MYMAIFLFLNGPLYVLGNKTYTILLILVLQSRKRVRIAAGKQPAESRAARESSDSSSEEDQNIEMEDVGRDDEPAATQYELMRDAGFEHLQHADEDDRRATQRIQRKELERQSNRAGAALNRPAENGILEEIECFNFMCHSHLRVPLAPHLNFIVGENGSGKSAILTAITLCLGGKASSTNRGGSLKAFIKEGQDRAILRIKIKNQGEDAFQPSLYGDTIIVERHFNRNGNGAFKVISENGKMISNKKSEVDEIVEYYCLQVDNPLNVLSQDNARQFLNQASAKQKYKFFLQGVQLQQLDDDYRVIEEYLNSNENKEGDLEIKLDNTRQEYERAKKDFALYMESENMRQQRRLLHQKLAWSQVSDVERKVAENEEKIVEAEEHIGEAQRNVDQKSQDLERLDEQIIQAEQEFATMKEEDAALQANVDKAQLELDEARKDLAKLRNDERDAHSRVKGAAGDVKDYKQKIQEEEQRLKDLNGDAHTRKNEELEAARARYVQIEQESAEAQRRIPDLNKDVEKAGAELKTVDQLVQQKKGDIATVQKRIRELEHGQGSLYDAYEPQIQQLLRMIEEDAGFERKPVGPVGAHIQVLQPTWSPMLERTIGEILNGFVVTSKRDQQRLKEMMNRLRITRSPIIIGNPRPIDISRSEPDENFDTILRILKIDEPLIRNQLIINNRIEKSILVQDKDDAERIMVSSAPPRNVGACFHLFPKRHDWTVRLTVNANGINSSPVRPPDANQKPRLKSDSQQETALYKEKLGQLQMELKELLNQKQAEQRAIDRCRKEVAEIKRTADRNKQRMRGVQVEIDEIKAQLDSFEGVDSRLEGLRADLNKAQETYDHYGGQYGEVGLKKQEQNGVCERLYKDVKREKAKHTEFSPRLKKAENKIKRGSDLRQITLQAKNEAHDALQIAENEKQRFEHKRERLQTTVAEFIEQANTICPRVHIGESETYELLEKKLDSLDKTLKDRERRRGMTDAQVRQRLEETQSSLEDQQMAFNRSRDENRALKKALGSRLKKWRMFQRYISSNSRANFMYLLSERDFRGRLVLDHEDHTLEVQVEPDKTRKNAAARNTKTLSGGEKSFSSICLLLAIWEAMGSPLRCLDEFDVFMDNVNRAISTNMLVSSPARRSISRQKTDIMQVSAARNSVGRQFILITPNAIEGRAKLDKDVNIIRYAFLAR